MIKKVLKLFIIYLILFTIIITTKSYCTYRTNSQKEYEAITKALEDYLSPYMGEDVDNYEKILSYKIGSTSSRGGPWKEGEMITSFSIKFHVEVPDKNNTKWLPYVNVVYMDFDIVDGTITGAAGDKFTAGELGDYTIEEIDGSTQIILGPPFKFDPSNIDEWKTVY